MNSSKSYPMDAYSSAHVGPPGTGKTSTIVGMVGALLAKYTTVTPSNNGSSLQQQQQQQKQQAAFTRTISNESGHARLLICAPSNAAVDEILSRYLEPSCQVMKLFG